MKIGKIGRLAILIAVFSAFFGLVIKGCEYFPESTFQLANEIETAQMGYHPARTYTRRRFSHNELLLNANSR